MAKNVIFWIIEEYSYFGIISSYILSRYKLHIGLNLWIWKEWYIITLIVMLE